MTGLDRPGPPSVYAVGRGPARPITASNFWRGPSRPTVFFFVDPAQPDP